MATRSAARNARGFAHVGLLAALATGLAVTGVVLFAEGGLAYYRSPVRARGAFEVHRLLRPSGPIGNILGLTGVTLMLVMHLYSVRRRYPHLRWMGTVPAWLEFHIFCGVLGPILITLHTSIKFNGLISVAYWSMVLVVASGFVGRYLYVRIPRSIRGQELTHEEVAARAAECTRRLAAMGLSETVLRKVGELEARLVPASEAEVTWRGLLLGDLAARWHLARFSHRLQLPRGAHTTVVEVQGLIRERATLLRRIAYLKRTRRLFELWHVYHRPLAVLMGVIVVVHVATAAYFGYALGLR
jgi:hypothetical protein